MPPDQALIQQYLSGDQRAAETLYLRYRAGLFRYLLRRLKRRHLAEESLQETFLRFFAQAACLSRHPRLGAWLFSVARNVSADIRRRRCLEAAPFSDLARANFETLLPAVENLRPDQQLLSRELSRSLMRAVRELPELEREVFFLRTQGGFSFREIAVKVGAPLNTVLSRMHRAMKRIRHAMNPLEEE
jgi:RNA polymerase sigma-70 factor (ECF subfamily)